MEADSEVLEIDRLEDEIAPLAAGVARIRELISGLELCHHKAERWVHNIVEAIGLGDTGKGLGTRRPGELHPREEVWRASAAGLAAWCAGCPAESLQFPAGEIMAGLGQRSPLKEWQVTRVVDKIRSVNDPAAPYVWMLLGGGEYESFYLARCPERYREHEDFWLATVHTLILDTESGESAALSLALAIDMLWPCHWKFLENLQIVLDAIGGKLRPEKPFAACGRNITSLPIRDRMGVVAATLRAFCGRPEADANVDPQVLALLGPSTPASRWLAASLDKTIRLQLDPPANLRAISALTGPDWLNKG